MDEIEGPPYYLIAATNRRVREAIQAAGLHHDGDCPVRSIERAGLFIAEVNRLFFWIMFSSVCFIIFFFCLGLFISRCR